MKFRLGLLATISILLSVVVSAPVYAHVEASDHGVSAEIHLPPDDQAIANRDQRIEFIFEDAPSTLSLKECDCSLRIAMEDGPTSTVSTQLDSTEADQLTSQTTFTRSGDYTLTLKGFTTAKHTQQFNLVYRLHVKPAPRSVSAATRKLTMVLTGVCVAAVFAVILFSYYYRGKRRKQASN
jgi:hypothetical protein